MMATGFFPALLKKVPLEMPDDAIWTRAFGDLEAPNVIIDGIKASGELAGDVGVHLDKR